MLGLTIPDVIVRAVMLIIVFPAHELAHALTATWMGDPTARNAGRLTLNPLKHLDPLGSILFIIAGFGWAKTPINPSYFGENARLKLGLVSLTGPLANLGLAVFGMLPFLVFGWLPTIEPGGEIFPSLPYFFSNFILLNLLLAVFNLIPISPLDGAAVFGATLTGQVAAAYDAFQRYGMLALMAILFLFPRLGFNPIGILLNVVATPFFGLLYFLMDLRLQLF